MVLQCALRHEFKSREGLVALLHRPPFESVLVDDRVRADRFEVFWIGHKKVRDDLRHGNALELSVRKTSEFGGAPCSVWRLLRRVRRNSRGYASRGGPRSVGGHATDVGNLGPRDTDRTQSLGGVARAAGHAKWGRRPDWSPACEFGSWQARVRPGAASEAKSMKMARPLSVTAGRSRDCVALPPPRSVPMFPKVRAGGCPCHTSDCEATTDFPRRPGAFQHPGAPRTFPDAPLTIAVLATGRVEARRHVHRSAPRYAFGPVPAVGPSETPPSRPGLPHSRRTHLE